MSLVDDGNTQRQRIAAATNVKAALALLDAVNVSDADEDLAVAAARLNDWLAVQPQYVLDSI